MSRALRLRRSVAALVAATLVAALGLAAPALATESGPVEPAPSTPTLLQIDATADARVVLRTAEAPADVDVRLRGVDAEVGTPVRAADTGADRETMLVIDNSVDATELLDEFVTAAVDYVERARATR